MGSLETEFVMGTWSLGSRGWSPISEEQAMATLDAAWEAGVRHFDCAAGYGEAQDRLGEFLKDKPRDSFTVASKAFPSKKEGGFERQYRQTHEQLGLDVIDTFFIHWPRSDTDLRPYMEFLEGERSAGRLRKIGVSNFLPRHLEQVSEAGTVDVYQGGYHLFWRMPEEEVVPWCKEHGIPLQAYSPLGQGILTGKFSRHPEFEEGDNRAKTVLFEEEVWPKVHAAVEELKQLAEAHNASLVAMALQWVVRQPGFANVVVGARKPEQIRANVEAFKADLSDDLFLKMTALSDRLQAELPEVTNFWRNDF
mgnify:CR=1 FL=1